MKHALIVGARGIGKSTLIQRILKDLGRPAAGFLTKKEIHLADEHSGRPVYIYDPGMPRGQSSDNLVGISYAHGFRIMKGAFDRYASKLLEPVPEGHVIVMDELGFLEAEEEQFCQAVLSLLDGDIPVIAAVKNKNVPFLESVRSHSKCRCFSITEENRDTLYQEVLDFMKEQIGEMEKSRIQKSGISETVSNQADLEYFISLQSARSRGRQEYTAGKWDRRAEFWNKERVNKRKGDERVDSAIAFLEQRGLLDPEFDVADIGCGPGRFAAAFARRVHAVVGLDVSEKMIGYGREYIEKEGLHNVRLSVCDFDTLDIEKEGYTKAFDLVFCSMTPAVHDRKSLQKSMEMSRAYCCNMTHIYSKNHLRDQIMRDVFGKEPAARWSGKWFYSLFNVLYLTGYCPETSYENRHQEIQVYPDWEYVEFVMEHMLPEAECTKKNGERILSWLRDQAGADGAVTEVTDTCYGRILWDVRDHTERPDYRSMESGI